MGRQKRNQTTHDRRVRALANMLKNQGWQVQADLPNFDPPDPIGKDERIPDIFATQGDRTKIIEVETPSTFDAHQDQHSTFKRSAAQRERGSLNWL